MLSQSRLPVATPAPSTRFRTNCLAALLAGAFAPLAAHATNGYLLDGYGAKAEGQAGVGIAWSQDALAAATNPAGTGLVGDRVDLGLVWFAPRRSADITGNNFGADASYSGDGKKNFFLPEFGWSHQLSSTLGAGIAVYGNGGLNTQYAVNPYGRFGATGTAGVDLQQLFVSPSIAWKPVAGQSLGLALNVAYQRFSAQGIGIFAGFSGSPANVSDKGTDSTLGAGVRIGWTGTLAPGLSAGATWSSKVRGSFSNYKGLFADGGRFDVPDNYGIGIAYQATAAWTVALDLQKINYSHVASVGDPINSLFQGVPLGATGGPGFGWQDITVGKLAVSYQVEPDLVLRAGYSHAGQTVPSSQTFFNILAPGVVQDHLTVGATGSLKDGGELTGFLAIAPGETVNGTGSIPPGPPNLGGFGGGEASVRLKETIVGVSYAWKL
jgi:long-chain fatty acid transport protein